MAQVPSIGRIVHYYEQVGAIVVRRPAIIVDIEDPDQTDLVTLKVFSPTKGDSFVRDVQRAPGGIVIAGKWDWPPIVTATPEAPQTEAEPEKPKPKTKTSKPATTEK